MGHACSPAAVGSVAIAMIAATLTLSQSALGGRCPGQRSQTRRLLLSISLTSKLIEPQDACLGSIAVTAQRFSGTGPASRLRTDGLKPGVLFLARYVYCMHCGCLLRARG